MRRSWRAQLGMGVAQLCLAACASGPPAAAALPAVVEESESAAAEVSLTRPLAGPMRGRANAAEAPRGDAGAFEISQQRSGAAASSRAPERPPLRPPTEWRADPTLPPAARTQLARESKGAAVRQLFEAARIPFPPAELLWRVFKQERELEVWASAAHGGSMELIATYGICASSGEVGPKRREGDGQVPEGYYRLAYLWPLSAYHLSMNIGYPNRSDRILGGDHPGSAIMIHGSCVSIGCIAMSDERIQELWVMAEAMQAEDRAVHLHLFPARGRGLDRLLENREHQRHWPFWSNLRQGLRLFERHRQLPRVTVDWRGRYRFALPTAG